MLKKMFNVILDYSDDDEGDDSGDDEGDNEIAWSNLLEGINQLYHLRLHVGSMTKKQGKCLFGALDLDGDAMLNKDEWLSFLFPTDTHDTIDHNQKEEENNSFQMISQIEKLQSKLRYYKLQFSKEEVQRLEKDWKQTHHSTSVPPTPELHPAATPMTMDGDITGVKSS